MPAGNITILESMEIEGGALDGSGNADETYSSSPGFYVWDEQEVYQVDSFKGDAYKFSQGKAFNLRLINFEPIAIKIVGRTHSDSRITA